MDADPTTRLRLDVALDQLLNPETQTLQRDRVAVREQRDEMNQQHRSHIRLLARSYQLALSRAHDENAERLRCAMTQAGQAHRARRAKLTATTAALPPLLEQLVDAVTSTGGAGNGARGVHRSPLNTTAVEVLADMRAAVGTGLPPAEHGPAVRDGHRLGAPCLEHTSQPCAAHLGDPGRGSYWCRDCGWASWTHAAANLAQTLRRWTPADLDAAADRAERWIVDARAIVTPARWTEAKRPCPACGNRHVFVTEDGQRIRKAAIQVNLTHGHAACIAPACGAHWDRTRFTLLAAALEQEDVAG